MRRLRFVAGALIAVVVALVVAIYVALSQLDLAAYRDTFQQRAEAATGRALRIAGAMDLELDLSPAVTIEDVSFANAPWSQQTDMAMAKRLELELALWPLLIGEVRVTRLILVKPTLRLERNAAGHANWTLGPADGPAGTTDGTLSRIPGIERIRIEDGKLSYRDMARGRHLLLTFRHAVAHSGSGSKRMDLRVAGSYQGIDFEVSGYLGRLNDLLSPAATFPVDLTATAADARLRLNGEMTGVTDGLDAELDVEATAENLARLGPILGLELPGIGPLDLRARLSAGDGLYRFSGLRADIGESDLSGEATIERGGDNPEVSAKLTAAVLDVADFRGKPHEESAASAPEDGERERLFGRRPLPLAPLRALDGEFDLKVGTLRLADGIAMSSVKTQITVSDGELSVQPLSARLGQGLIELGAVVDAGRTPTRLKLDLNATGIDYGRLLADMAITDQVTGTLDAEAHLNGRGKTPSALAASLRGRTTVTGGKGHISDSLLAAASAGVAEAIAPWRQSEDGVRLNCVVAQFDVNDGVMTTRRALLADTETVTLAGDGRISLAEERFDLTFVPRAKQPSLASLAIPMQVTGPLSDPTLAPEPFGAAKAGAVAIGSVINPLAALGAILIDSAMSDDNPCVAALEAAAKRRDKAGRAADGDGSGALGGLKGFMEGLSESIDKQLGVQGDDAEDDPALLPDGSDPGGR